MDIRISSPIRLALEILDAEEEYFPSLSFHCLARIQPSSQSAAITYEDRFWIQAGVFDAFVDGLRTRAAEAIFESVDGYFSLRVARTGDTILFRLAATPRILYVSRLSLQYEVEISEDTALILKERFVAFPKWW